MSAEPSETAVPHAPADDPLRLPANVKVLSAVSLANDIASEMLYPLLPALLRSMMGSTYQQIGIAIGIIEGAADAVASILKLFAGGWSDRTGRRKSWIVAGYSLSAAAKPLMGLVVAPWQLLVCRVGERIGKGLRTSARDAVIAESTPPEARGWAFGFHRAADHAGAAIGPGLATLFLWMWPDRLPLLFQLSLVPGVIVVLILVFFLREPRHSITLKQPFAMSLAPFDRNFRWYLMSLGVFTLGNSSDMFLLTRSGELGVAPKLLPVLWCLFNLSKSFGNMAVGRLVHRIGARRLIVIGWGMYAVIYIGFGFASTAWHAWVLFLAYAVFYALTEPPEKTLVAQLVPADRKGLAFGWYNFALGVASFPASLLFGALYQNFGALTAFATGAALAAVATLLLLGVRETPQGA